MIKFKKPGPPAKKKPKAKRLLIHSIEKPKELHCRRCNLTTGTECFRHYEGFRKHQFGRGTGEKGSDKATAFLCMDCDSIMSSNPNKRSDFISLESMSHSEEWLYLIHITWLI